MRLIIAYKVVLQRPIADHLSWKKILDQVAESKSPESQYLSWSEFQISKF